MNGKDRGTGLEQRLMVGDTMAVIEAQEWLDELCTAVERVDGVDPLEVDYLGSVTAAGAGLIAAVLPILYAVDEGDNDRATRIAESYRRHGGRQVRYRSGRIIVWLGGSDPTWDVFDAV